jgi:hypothetical protein
MVVVVFRRFVSSMSMSLSMPVPVRFVLIVRTMLESLHMVLRTPHKPYKQQQKCNDNILEPLALLDVHNLMMAVTVNPWL